MQSTRFNFHKTQYQVLIALLFLCAPIVSKAQFGGGSIAIFGPTSATTGETKNYSLAAPSNITSTNWYASTGATIQSSSTFAATVSFNSAGTRQISAVSIDTFFSFYTDDLNVSVTVGIPNNPGNPTVASTNCGQAVLQRSGSPPSGVTWYWQGKNSNGTSTTKGSGSTFTANEGNGTYYIRARSSSGQWSTGSGSRYVTMTNFQPGSISGTQNICYGGDPATISNTAVASGGNGYSYQWQYSNNGSSGWTNISFATQTSYNPPSGLTASRWYRRRVNSCGQYWYTNVVKVTVYGNLYAGIVGGTSTICYGGNPGPLGIISSPSGGNGSYSYQWQYSTNGSSGWTNISGATSGTYDPPSGLTSDRWYRKRVISCGQTKYTGGVKITVRPSASAGTIAGAQTRCFDEQVSILTTATSPSGGDGSYSYQWQYSNNGSSGWTNISGATGSTYDPPGTLAADRWYRKRVISCSQTVYTASVKVSIDQGQTYYYDTDSDGYGDSGNSIVACTQPAGTVTNSSDHDDSTNLVTNITPQTWYKDADGDGYGDNSATLTASFKRLGWATNNTDQCPNDPGSGNGCGSFTVTHSDENYVAVKSYQDVSESEVIENVSYFDGLGRKKQDVAIRASGSSSAKSPNLAPGWSMDWTVGTGSTSFFNQNGTTSENSRVQGPDPFGKSATIWECGNDQSSNSDGGWNTNSVTIDKTKTYRYTVWVRRNHSQNGTTYHGTQHVNNLSGSANGNPYFWYGDLPQLDTWYLMVGIIHPHTYGTANSGVSGVYDLQGNKVDDGTDFKWRSDTTTSYFRSYLYYCTDVNVRQYFHAPTLEVVDGNELPLQKFFDDGKPKDVVTHAEYDTYGRASKQYLPYMEYGNIGAFRSGAKTATDNHYTEFYGSDINSGTPNPFSETEYEASPLNRVLKQAAPGYDWRMGGGHEIEFGYETNAANEVRFFKVTFSGGNTEAPQLSNSGYYPAKELYKKVTYDENHNSGTNHSTEEFTNKRGQVVLKRTYNNGAHDTYYVYDDFGNLTYVIPPKVTTDNVSTTELNELCYQYKYDHRNRLVEKKIPGKDPEEIVYNKLDQPILTRDANLEASGKWLTTKYDAFGRVAYTGMVNSTIDRAGAQSAADSPSYPQYASSTSSRTIAGTTVYYSNDTFPTSTAEILTVNYYDDYRFDDDTAFGLTVPTGSVLGQPISTNTQGLPTGSKVKILGTTDWVTTLTAYDVKGRPIYVATKNGYLNTLDIVETELDFAGKVIRTVSSHTKGSNPAIVTSDNFTYDQMSRLVQQTQTIGSHTETVVENSYDELGQLVEKKMGGGLQTVDYQYNVRGWLKQINDPSNLGNDLFAFGINYSHPTHGGTALYNGNIAETEWRTANTDNALKWYRYGYDALNRILTANYNNAAGTEPNWYNISNVSYDKNGNLLTLNRTKKGTPSAGAAMDYLTYTIDSGNKLLKVEEQFDGAGSFEDGTNGSNNDYTYDDNGNMLTDANKGITGISYNHLNLPTSISINGAGGNGTISYIYDATGIKLKKTVGSSVTEYAGNHIYENGSLQFFNHPEGYVTPDGSGGYDYIYQHKDHLGNVRLSFIDNNGTTEIVEENNYYPFGLKHKGYNEVVSPLGNSVANKWKYNGMELDEGLGLETYDFGARNYDPALGRWMNLDPLAEQMRRHSPYNYAYNNPVAFIDPDGMLGQAAWASSFGISLSSMGSMFTESEAAVQRRQRQAIYDNINSVLNGDSEEVENDDQNGDGDDCCGVTSTDNRDGTTTLSSNGLTFTTNTLTLDGVSKDSRSSLTRNTKRFLGVAGRAFSLGAMGLSYSPELAKAGEIGVLGSKYLRTFGRIAGGATIGLDYFAYRNGEISAGRFRMNTFYTGLGLFGGPFGWAASGSYFIMGDLLGGHERAKENFDKWQSYTPEQKREAIRKSLKNKHGGGELGNPKF